MSDFKRKILDAIIHDIKVNPKALAAWVGGSAATKTTDQYSDIDLTIVGSDSVDLLFEAVESTLKRITTINHKWIEPKSFWPGCFQRIYILADSPKHFFVDVAVVLRESDELLLEFMNIERHGHLIVQFDKIDILKPRSGDPAFLKTQLLNRLSEIEYAFPIYKINVLKELDREHSIDAFSFYIGGLVKPLVEVMGMIHRPYRFDFGLRYLHKTFPLEDQKLIEKFLYPKDIADLRNSVTEIDLLLKKFAILVRQQLINNDRTF